MYVYLLLIDSGLFGFIFGIRLKDDRLQQRPLTRPSSGGPLRIPEQLDLFSCEAEATISHPLKESGSLVEWSMRTVTDVDCGLLFIVPCGCASRCIFVHSSSPST